MTQSKPSVGLGTTLLLVAIGSSVGFALGRATSPEAPPLVTLDPTRPPEPAPMATQGDSLPPGHPPIGQGQAQPMGAAEPAPAATGAPTQRALAWTVPPNWQEAPSTSSMRIATYKAPIAKGDSEAPELSVIQAGGDLDANIERWAGQFGDEGKTSLKREKKTVADYPVTVVSLQGTFSGGMGMGMGGEPRELPQWALLGAIVETAEGAYFFKMTGPAKSVAAARSDFDAFVASMRRP